jgi:hypothetical protein
MSTTVPPRRTGDTEPTIESWRAYREQGGRRVQFVGLHGNAPAGIYGTISRVTTANVFVLIDGQVKPEPFHPADLRPTNVWPKATS